MERRIKKVFVIIAVAMFAFFSTAGFTVDYVAASSEPTQNSIWIGEQDVDLSGQYHAYILYRSENSWTFRNSFYEKKTGRDSPEVFEHMAQQMDGKLSVVNGEITDAVIQGNGVYTVKITGLTTTGTDTISILGFSTDIPYNEFIQFTDVHVNVDGVEKLVMPEACLDEEARLNPHTMSVIAVNPHCTSLEDTNWEGPRNSVEITFSVSGFDYDAEVVEDQIPLETEISPTPASDAVKEIDIQSKGTLSVIPIVAMILLTVTVGIIIGIAFYFLKKV